MLDSEVVIKEANSQGKLRNPNPFLGHSVSTDKKECKYSNPLTASNKWLLNW